MSGNSNVGNSQVYEAGDQRNVSRAEQEEEKQDNRFHEGKEHSHKALDSSKSCITLDSKVAILMTAYQRTRDPSPTNLLANRRYDLGLRNINISRIGVTLLICPQRENEPEEESEETKALKKDPTLPVKKFLYYLVNPPVKHNLPL